MADNGEKKFQKIIEGIQYLVGDNKHVREDLREFSRQAEADRRRADEDRRRADEDRRRADERFELLIGRMDEDRVRSDEKFASLLDQVKRTNRVAVEIARDLRKQLARGHAQLLERLDAILERLPRGSNGK